MIGCESCIEERLSRKVCQYSAGSDQSLWIGLKAVQKEVVQQVRLESVLDAHIKTRPDFSRHGKQYLLKPVPCVGVVISARSKGRYDKNGRKWVKRMDSVFGEGIAIGHVNGRLLAAWRPVETELGGVQRAAAGPVPTICLGIHSAAGGHVGRCAVDTTRTTNEIAKAEV